MQTEFVDVAHKSGEIRAQQLWGLNIARLKTKFHAKIMLVADMYVRWWNLIQEPAPNICSFRELGHNIRAGISQAKQLWRTFVKTSSIHISALGLYVRFFEQILGDKRKAARLKEKYGEYTSAGKVNDGSLAFKSCGPDEGIVEISAKREKMGTVVSHNRAFCQISGYYPGELLNANITVLMPEIYREAHKSALERCCKTVEAGGKCDLDKGIRAHLLNKGGFLVPIVIKIVDLPHFVNGYSFVAGVSVSAEFRDYTQVNLLLDLQFCILATSSSTLALRLM